MSHFNTVEAAPHNFEGKICLEAETLEEIQKTWKMSLKSSSKDEDDYFQKRRIENYSWRIMSKISQHDVNHTSGHGLKRRKSMNVMFDGSKEAGGNEDYKSISHSSSSEEGRRRSATMPSAYAPHTDATVLNEESLGMLNLDNLAKASPDGPLSSSSPNRHILEAKSKALLRRHTNRQTFERQIGKVGKGTLCLEYTDYGTGDFRTPSFMVVDSTNGSALSPLRYRRHKIYKGKLPMPDSMPSIRNTDDSEASTLLITLGDTNSGLEVDLIYGKA